MRAQINQDAQTWVPVAFFSFVEHDGKDTELCQLWVSVLGQTEWRKVETRNVKEMGRVFSECTAFDGGTTQEDT